MGKILSTLEEQLKNQWLEGETLKIWEDWRGWLQDRGCPYQLQRPPHLPDNRPFNYQTFLKACESQMVSHPEWQARLCTPSWLQRHHIKLVPEALKKKTGGGPGVDLTTLQADLTRLVDQIHSIQQQMGHLEGSPAPSVPSLAKEISAATQSTAGLNAKISLLAKPDAARLLERELRLAGKSPGHFEKASAKEEQEPAIPKIVPLKDAYLTFNRWCEQFEDINLMLGKHVNGPLRVAGSHEISYVQFCHRLRRLAQNAAGLEHDLEAFARLRKNGVNVNLHSMQPAETANEEGTKPRAFTLPPQDEYRGFNAWLDWLKTQGIETERFSNEDLSVESSHQISFVQFCRRLERRLEQPEEFRRELGLPVN